MSELENCCGTTCDKSALAEELSKLQQLNAELELAIKTKEAENKIFFMAARNLWNAILLGKDEDLSTLAVLLKASIYTLDLENRLAQHDRDPVFVSPLFEVFFWFVSQVAFFGFCGQHGLNMPPTWRPRGLQNR